MRLHRTIPVVGICLVVIVAVAYAAGKVNADAAIVTIGVIATAIAGFSLLLSGKTSEAALDEVRRRNLLDRRPSLVVVTSRDKERRVPNYYLVRVRNSGPGVAHKVRVSLNWECPAGSSPGNRPVEACVDSLPAQGILELPRETPCTLRGTERIWGTMTCDDIAGEDSYWWRRVGPDAKWQSGTGAPPEDS